MKLIFGGAYQGKLDYAKEKHNLTDADIFFCRAEDDYGTAGQFIDFSGKAVCGLEEFVLHCVRSATEAKDYLEVHRSEWKDMIIICTDISAGVVPFEKEARAWREMVGRTLVYLGREADEVTRIFCGLPQKIK